MYLLEAFQLLWDLLLLRAHLLLKRGGTTLLFHHKLQTRNHGDTPHKKDLMMLMIERCAMVAIEVLRGKKKELIHTVWKILHSLEQQHVSISNKSHFETLLDDVDDRALRYGCHRSWGVNKLRLFTVLAI